MTNRPSTPVAPSRGPSTPSGSLGCGRGRLPPRPPRRSPHGAHGYWHHDDMPGRLLPCPPRRSSHPDTIIAFPTTGRRGHLLPRLSQRSSHGATTIDITTTRRRGRLLPCPPWPVVPSWWDWQTGGRQTAGLLEREWHDGPSGHGRSRPLPGRVAYPTRRGRSRPQPEDGDPSAAKTAGADPDHRMVTPLMASRHEVAMIRHGGPSDGKTAGAGSPTRPPCLWLRRA